MVDGVHLGRAGRQHGDFRPGDPTRSYALARMNVRAENRQMPLIGTNRVDLAGSRVLADWIVQMTVARGYPEAGP